MRANIFAANAPQEGALVADGYTIGFDRGDPSGDSAAYAFIIHTTCPAERAILQECLGLAHRLIEARRKEKKCPPPASPRG